MIDVDLRLIETYTDHKDKTLTLRFRVALETDDRPTIAFVWPVVLDLSLSQEPLPDTPTAELRHLAFAVLEVQLEAIRQKIQFHPGYDAAQVAHLRTALEAEIEAVRKVLDDP